VGSEQLPIFTPSGHASQEQLQSELGSSQNSSHKNSIPRPCSRSSALASGLDFAEHHQIERHPSPFAGAPGCVTAGEPQPEKFGRPGHPREQFAEPGSAAFDGQDQAQKKKARPRAHCDDVARSSSKRFIADRCRGMFIDQKVSALQELVARDSPILVSRMD